MNTPTRRDPALLSTCRRSSSPIRGALIGLCLVAGLVGYGASAAQAGEAERKVALDLVRLVTPRESYEAMIKQMINQMIPAMKAQGSQFPPNVEEKMRKAITEAISYDEVIDWTADVYANRFSVGELRELIGFYKTPLGRKLAKLMPDISGEAGRKMGTIIPQRLPAAMKKHGLLP